jgi:hypothetical protein
VGHDLPEIEGNSGNIATRKDVGRQTAAPLAHPEHRRERTLPGGKLHSESQRQRFSVHRHVHGEQTIGVTGRDGFRTIGLLPDSIMFDLGFDLSPPGLQSLNSVERPLRSDHSNGSVNGLTIGRSSNAGNTGLGKLAPVFSTS